MQSDRGASGSDRELALVNAGFTLTGRYANGVAVPTLLSRYRSTFGHVVAVIYTGGTVAQALHLLLAFGWEDMPFWIDWALIVLGTYGGVGLVLFARAVAWRGTWEKVVHGLITLHLLVSVFLHAWIVAVGSHQFFTVFPYEYSYFALAYFGFFAWRSWTVKLIPESAGRTG